jgi:hypothetical protein
MVLVMEVMEAGEVVMVAAMEEVMVTARTISIKNERKQIGFVTRVT